MKCKALKFYFKHTRKPKEPIVLAILRNEKANWLDSAREKKCSDKSVQKY